jgi:hypothetical protein
MIDRVVPPLQHRGCCGITSVAKVIQKRTNKSTMAIQKKKRRMMTVGLTRYRTTARRVNCDLKSCSHNVTSTMRVTSSRRERRSRGGGGAALSGFWGGGEEMAGGLFQPRLASKNKKHSPRPPRPAPPRPTPPRPPSRAGRIQPPPTRATTRRSVTSIVAVAEAGRCLISHRHAR